MNPAIPVPEADQQSANIIYYSDAQNHLVWANAAFEEFARDNGATDLYTKLIGTSLVESFSGAHHNRLKAIYAQLLNGQLLQHVEHVACPSPDYRREYQLKIVPLSIEGTLYLRHESVSLTQHIKPVEAERQATIEGQQDGLEYYGMQQSLEAACGDALWMQTLDDGRRVFLIADAMGHGERAAIAIEELLVSLAQTTFDDLQQTIVHVNQYYLRRNPGKPGEVPFVTGLLMLVDLGQAQLEVVSFGHDGLIFTPAGPISIPSGLPIGILNDYEQWPVTMLDFKSLGYRFLAYTDGVVEQFDTGGRVYSLDNLAKWQGNVLTRPAFQQTAPPQG